MASKTANITKVVHASATALMVFVGAFLFNTIMEMREELSVLKEVKGDVDKVKTDVSQIKKKNAEDEVQWKILNSHSKALTDVEVQVRVNHVLTEKLLDGYDKHHSSASFNIEPRKLEKSANTPKQLERKIEVKKSPKKHHNEYKKALDKLRGTRENHHEFKHRHVREMIQQQQKH